MAQRGRNLLVLSQDDVVDAAELPTRLLSWLKHEVLLNHAEASLQWLIILISFI
jgi:hypothetical protein